MDFVPPYAQDCQQLYFLKQGDGEISNVSALEKHVDYGVLTGDCLDNLETVLKEVYGPLLEFELGAASALAAAPAAGAAATKSSSPDDDEGIDLDQVTLKVSDSMRNELRSNLQRFQSHISQAHSQVCIMYMLYLAACLFALLNHHPVITPLSPYQCR